MSIFGVPEALNFVSNIISKAIPDPMQKAQAEALLEQVRQQPDVVQAEINSIEAAHPNIFVSGWRPAIGWICGFAFLIGLLSKIMLPTIIILVSIFVHDLSSFTRYETKKPPDNEVESMP